MTYKLSKSNLRFINFVLFCVLGIGQKISNWKNRIVQAFFWIDFCLKVNDVLIGKCIFPRRTFWTQVIVSLLSGGKLHSFYLSYLPLSIFFTQVLRLFAFVCLIKLAQILYDGERKIIQTILQIKFLKLYSTKKVKRATLMFTHWICEKNTHQSTKNCYYWIEKKKNRTSGLFPPCTILLDNTGIQIGNLLVINSLLIAAGVLTSCIYKSQAWGMNARLTFTVTEASECL